MNWIKGQYGADTPIYVTENGYADGVGNFDDMHREYYYKHYINQLLKGAILYSKHRHPMCSYVKIYSLRHRWGKFEGLLCLVSHGQL